MPGGEAVYDWGLSSAWSVAFAPDGLTLAVAGAGPDGGKVVLWDAEA